MVKQKRKKRRKIPKKNDKKLNKLSLLYRSITKFLKEHPLTLISIFIGFIGVILAVISIICSEKSTNEIIETNKENTSNIIEEMRNTLGPMVGPGLSQSVKTDSVEISNNKILEKAFVYHKESKFDSAFALYNEVLMNDSLNKVARFNRIPILFDYYNELSKSKIELEQYIKIFTNDPDGYYNLGFLNDKIGDLNAANSYYKICLEINPTHLYALHNFSNNVVKLNNLQEGIIYHEKAIKYNPEFFPSIGWLGAAYFSINNYQKAEYYLNKWFTNIEIEEKNRKYIKGVFFNAKTLELNLIVDKKYVEKAEILKIDIWKNKVSVHLILK